MESAFGVDHGEISKASFGGVIPGAARAVGTQARGFKAGFKMARANGKAARSQAGLATTPGASLKQGFQAGRAGTGGQLRAANMAANRTARANTRTQLGRG